LNNRHYFCMEWCFATGILLAGISPSDAHAIAYAAVPMAWHYFRDPDAKYPLPCTIRK
jgi:hypothetical protein